jgi:hypothetical protein
MQVHCFSKVSWKEDETICDSLKFHLKMKRKGFDQTELVASQDAMLFVVLRHQKLLNFNKEQCKEA